MNDLTIGQGETIRQTVTVEEDGATSATLVVTDGTTDLITEVANFGAYTEADGATADISTTDTVIPVGTYDMYIKIIWDDSTIDYIPDFSDCEDECTLPKLIVCEVPGVS